MGRVTVAVCMLLLMAGLVHARDYELTKKAGEYTVRVMIDKNPPVTGKNNMSVGIKDGASQDVTDAKKGILINSIRAQGYVLLPAAFSVNCNNI